MPGNNVVVIVKPFTFEKEISKTMSSYKTRNTEELKKKGEIKCSIKGHNFITGVLSSKLTIRNKLFFYLYNL